ncbi:uncharacterized protein LOC124190690 [Daphnia pulex]|uniref:uncharacterized protein LOC124190690 n=1 Tax=Daphnia pulex TaxID=6669 RepID=UPI001EDE4B97|nr:uncharacterized protein LOC124190690 [Daphnia pulex]XP_046439497.1 uncharacterized protein LOC124190690 [Daphnia pulex]
MALLTRFIRLPDRANTHVFTFVVTRSVTRDLHRDVTSKEFSYGYHRWAITFSRAGKVLGVYLVWRNPSEGMRVYIDFSFTLLNREHFSSNETFSGRQIKFTFDSPAQGNRRYIPVDDLYERNFTDSNGEFQLELTVANPRTLYETDLRLPLSSPGSSSSTTSLAATGGGNHQRSASPLPSHHHHHNHHHHHQLGGSTGNLSTLGQQANHVSHHNSGHHGSLHLGHGHPPTQLPKTTKMETTYFAFGGFDWNLSVVVEPYSVTAATSAAGLTLNLAAQLGGSHERESPSHRSRSNQLLAGVGDPMPASIAGVLGDHVGNGTLALRLRRLTGVDHRSRSRYYISVGEGDRRLSSGLMDDISDAEGAGSVWCPRVRMQDVAPKGVLRLMVELVSANTLSEALITLAPTTQVTGTPGSIGGLSAGTCYDRDKQAWSFEADTHSENGTLRVRVVYRDVRNVPRNHIRYVSWQAAMLRPNNKVSQCDAVPFSSTHYSNYYVQEEADDGVVMESSVPVKDLLKTANGYVNDKQQLRVQVEWDETLLLFQATYHKYDDVGRIHNYQMRKEISALQSENYSLERQLFSYQRSLAMAQARNGVQPQGPSDDNTPSSSANGEYPPHRDHSHSRDFFARRDESSDTEYA